MKNRKKRSRKQGLLKGCYKKTRKNYSGGTNLVKPNFFPNSSAYPSPGPNPAGFNFLNPSYQTGGSNCASCQLTGGSFPMTRVSKQKHRINCKCSECRNMQSGGNGLIGKPWGPNISQWPGVDGSRNHLGYNTYTPNDVSREMKYENASGGGKKYRQKGGFIVNDLLNLGKFGTGSFYNAIKGYPQPVSPMPWKDQLTKY